MIRATLLLSTALLASPLSALAQSQASLPGAPATPAPPAAPSPSQLDRIEAKLDEVLHRLDQPRPQPAAVAQGQEAPLGAASSSSGPSLVPAAPAQAYKPGALAIVHAAPKDANSLSEIPPDSVGGFTYTGGPIALTDIKTRGVRYAGPVGVEIQGWLQAKEAGRYQIGTDLTAHFSGMAIVTRLASCRPGSKAAALTSVPSLSASLEAAMPSDRSSREPSCSPASIGCASGQPAPPCKASAQPPSY